MIINNVIPNVIEISFSLGLFLNAILFIPQSVSIIINKDAKNVSLVMFIGFLLIQLSTLLHGILRNDWLLTVGTLISMITCGHVTWLIIYYRTKSKPVSDHQIKGL